MHMYHSSKHLIRQIFVKGQNQTQHHDSNDSALEEHVYPLTEGSSANTTNRHTE